LCVLDEERKSRFSSLWSRDSSTERAVEADADRRDHRASRSITKCAFVSASADQILQLREELVHVLELPVDRGETDVRDLVELPQPVHDERSDPAVAISRSSASCSSVSISSTISSSRAGGTGRFLAGLDQSRPELLAVEAPRAAVLLDDHVGNLLDRLVGGEAAPAGGALARRRMTSPSRLSRESTTRSSLAPQNGHFHSNSQFPIFRFSAPERNRENGKTGTSLSSQVAGRSVHRLAAPRKNVARSGCPERRDRSP
jgi:hypothetical protein